MIFAGATFVVVRWQQDKNGKEARDETEGKSGRLFMFDDNKIKMARKPGKKLKESPVGYTWEGHRWKENIREGSRDVEMGTILGVEKKNHRKKKNTMDEPFSSIKIYYLLKHTRDSHNDNLYGTSHKLK